MCRLLVGRFYDSGGGVLLWRGWVGMGDVKWEMGNEKWEMGNGKWEIRSGKTGRRVLFCLTIVIWYHIIIDSLGLFFSLFHLISLLSSPFLLSPISYYRYHIIIHNL